MGSYLQVEITGPLVDLEKVKLKKLPTWELDDSYDWELDEMITRVRSEPNPETGLRGWHDIKTGQWHITFSGNSKWTCEEAFSWASRFTEKRPSLTVTVRDEWDNRDADEPGIEERVYRLGVLDLGASKQNGEVPMNLHDLLQDARRALATTDPGAKHDALTALVAGLA
jgi:hypothetical protein